MWNSSFGSSYSGARGGGPMRGDGYGWRDAGPYGGKKCLPVAFGILPSHCSCYMQFAETL